MEHFRVGDRHYELQRYPLRSGQKLRAWDTADDYLLDHCAAEFSLPLKRDVLLVGDAFGALAVALHDHSVTTWSDSWHSRLALQHNLEINELASDSITFVPGDLAPTGHFDVVLLKLPKSMPFWEDTLLRLRPCLKPETVIVAGGMIKHTPKRAWTLMEQIIGPTRTTLGRRKARLGVADFDPSLDCPPLLDEVWFELPDFGVTLHSRANVFSRDRLDNGTRLLLQHLPAGDGARAMADLGCGNGALSIALAKLNPTATILGTDISWQAVASARDNAARVGLASERVRFEIADALAEVDASTLDLVACNPPFHQDRAVGDDLAWSMFNHARRVLRPGGRFLVVGNRHLAWHIKLTRLFGGCRVVGSNQKFVVLESERRG